MQANSYYPLQQALKAKANDNPRKLCNWIKVLTGMQENMLECGSRRPVKDKPVWVTLEVTDGGFATGDCLAGGALLDEERKVLQAWGLDDGKETASRLPLNNFFVGDEGLRELDVLLATNQYRINVSEEGALLAMYWMMRNGHHDKAQSIYLTILPYFDRLRFYPLICPSPATPINSSSADVATVTLRTVQQAKESLADVEVPRMIAAQRETLLVWLPLYDRMVALFAETYQNDWPCQSYPPDWNDRACALLADLQQQLKVHSLVSRPRDRKGNFHVLSSALTLCTEKGKGPSALTGRQVGMIRCILVTIQSKRGLPQSATHLLAREHQSRCALGTTVVELARAVVERLQVVGSTAGQGLSVEQFEQVTAPVLGRDLPVRFRLLLARSVTAPIPWLVHQGAIRSCETLAGLVPQISSSALSLSYEDPALRELYQRLYLAFSKRRSLLLLNYQKQVQFKELPWVAAIQSVARPGDKAQIQHTLSAVFLSAIRAFPQTILPNPLVRQLSSLDGDLPLVEELAIDIFMGSFSPKFRKAAQIAARVLEGSLYQTYYAIDPKDVLELKDDNDFSDYCRGRAGVARYTGRYEFQGITVQARIIEQEQIVTTHNLAVLMDSANLRDTLSAEAMDLAVKTYRWILPLACRALHRNESKLCAYAWRQMVFLLSLVDRSRVLKEFLPQARETLEAMKDRGFVARFTPALNGLEAACRGESVEKGASGRVVLGWTVERHWLLPQV